ncbi:hypothetical protein ACFYZ5_27485 [Streptomyces chartreusis]|uniref:hypothetical protein n=1 Tax=Streptomyces chartreusis TaxID=1969 RepID=UPI0036B39718
MLGGESVRESGEQFVLALGGRTVGDSLDGQGLEVRAGQDSAMAMAWAAKP